MPDLDTDTRRLLLRTAKLAADFLESLERRPVGPQAVLEDLRAALGGPLPDGPEDPIAVVERLARDAGPGLVGMAGGRYFGFVIGGGVPAALGADWLTSAWDQNAGLFVCGPSAAVVEEVAHAWLADLLGLPAGTSFAVTTGCQMAHVTCLAAAREHVLSRAGWDVNESGLAGAPPIRVVAGARRHVTVDRALRFLGLGRAALRAVESDAQGRMRTDALREALASGGGPTIVCAQAGEVNTGAFDDLAAAADLASAAGAWLHVDGAFGLWAAASPSLRHLVRGVERADSWATDAHKWLNVPYDSGLAFTAHPAAHRKAMAVQAGYLQQAAPGAERDEVDWTPEFSRRARGFALWAALRSLGRRGIADLVERSCAHARRFARELGAVDGCEVLNEVVLNQALVRFGDDEATREVTRRVQAGGEAWMSGTAVDGKAALRISVVNWRTTDEDVGRAVAALRLAWSAVRAQRG